MTVAYIDLQSHGSDATLTGEERRSPAPPDVTGFHEPRSQASNPKPDAHCQAEERICGI